MSGKGLLFGVIAFVLFGFCLFLKKPKKPKTKITQKTKKPKIYKPLVSSNSKASQNLETKGLDILFFCFWGYLGFFVFLFFENTTGRLAAPSPNYMSGKGLLFGVLAFVLFCFCLFLNDAKNGDAKNGDAKNRDANRSTESFLLVMNDRGVP